MMTVSTLANACRDFPHLCRLLRHERLPADNCRQGSTDKHRGNAPTKTKTSVVVRFTDGKDWTLSLPFPELVADRAADVILVSHSFATMRGYCDAGGVLSNGVLRMYDRLEDAIAAHRTAMQRGPEHMLELT